jgi:hypothetical protein
MWGDKRTGIKLAWLAVLCALVLNSACQPSVTPVAQPTPQVIELQATFALQPLGEMFHYCIEEQPGYGLVVLEKPAYAIEQELDTLGMRWGLHQIPEYYAAEVGSEDLVLIANTALSIESIPLTALAGLYSGNRPTEPQFDVQPWAYPSGDDVQQNFESVILEGGPVEARAVYLAPDPAAMLQAVADNADAIGYIPSRWLDDTVKPIAVTGMPEDRFSFPYVVISNSEPVGPERAWLLCLHEAMSE